MASSSTLNLSRFSRRPTSVLPSELPRFSFSRNLSANSRPLKHESYPTFAAAFSCRRGLCTKAVLSEEKQYFKVGAESTGPIPADQLLDVIETAAKTGAQVL